MPFAYKYLTCYKEVIPDVTILLQPDFTVK